jgi:hypothetical protein
VLAHLSARREREGVPVRVSSMVGHGRNWRWAEMVPLALFHIFFSSFSFLLSYFLYNFYKFGPN